MEELKQTYTIAEGCTLPSEGKIYNVAINPNIELRSMTARDEMKRLAPTTTPLKNIAEIIEGCMLEKPTVHVYDLATADYEYLLHKLRIITYGSDYKIEVTCPNCGETVEAIANLDELEIAPFDEAAFEENSRVTLSDNRIVTIKFSTPHIMEDIDAKAKELKHKFKEAILDFNTFATLLSIIDTVDNNKLAGLEKENFINRLPAKDMLKIINKYDKLNNCFGINNNLTVKCGKCGGDIATYFRFGPEFFRPTTI